MIKEPIYIIRSYEQDNEDFVPPMQENGYFLAWGTMSSSVFTEDGQNVLLNSDICAVIMRIDGHVERIKPENIIFKEI